MDIMTEIYLKRCSLRTRRYGIIWRFILFSWLCNWHIRNKENMYCFVYSYLYSASHGISQTEAPGQRVKPNTRERAEESGRVRIRGARACEMQTKNALYKNPNTVHSLLQAYIYLVIQ